MEKYGQSIGWGKVTDDGVEIWDSVPVFTGDTVTMKDWGKLLFYPKKLLLYRWIKKTLKRSASSMNVMRVLDVGCGTGAAVIDLKKLFGRAVDVVGIDVVQLQIELGRKKTKRHGVVAQLEWYDGSHLPFPSQSFDAVYTSDVLGHVSDVPAWMHELVRVLKPGGALAMFSESKLGRHAWIRQYLLDRGLNVDPHAAFHVSLYSKAELRSLVTNAGFEIHLMYSAFWPAFFLHPDEFHPALSGQKRFPLLRTINKWLYWLKQKTHPYSTAAAELYGLIEMLTIGRWVESQGYIILARKA